MFAGDIDAGQGDDNAEVSEGWDLLDTVCCICDDGGDVICCDGDCFRSFHLSKGDSECPSLGLSKAQADRMDKFFCLNCKLKIHQCFVCRQLRRSDAAAAPEVFKCKVPMCGLFYHPSCVAKVTLKASSPSDEYKALVKSIKQGNWFDCPRHTCRKCGGHEDKENTKKQFGICRRCPRAWHQQCLPHSVLHPKAGEPQRAWENLLPKRILIFCERHTIIPQLGTPARNHVLFPEASVPSLQKRPIKRKAYEEEQKRKRSKVSILKKRDEACVGGETSAKLLKGNTEKKVKPILSFGQTMAEDRALMKSKLGRATLGCQALNTKVRAQTPAAFLIKVKNKEGSSARQECSPKEDGLKLSKPQILSMFSKSTSVSNAKLWRTNALVLKSGVSSSHLAQQKAKPLESKLIMVDTETRSMVKGIIERAKSAITIESVAEKHVVPTGYERNTINFDKIYTLNKIESIVKGMRKALETLENGGSVEDAKVKCSPEFLKFVDMCNRHLRSYLCPFLHGRRYTSFGRHFTNPVKLIEIVERLHWYVDEGDMVVDFCCGSNDFSLLMKQKMEETGKECDYKNFDLIQTNKEFKFFKGNWFDVKEDQFPDGNRLVMGLNPPFALANRFINHALKFKPKLVILIVPKETERLDQKRDMYDLIWEDSDLLGGKSFYLPGSLDEDDNTLEDWNLVTSPLYVWSKPNWTFKHRQIALEKGHISLASSSRFVGNPCSKTSLRIPSDSDFVIEKDNKLLELPMEHGGEEGSHFDENKSCLSTVVEPIVMHVPKDGQDTGLEKESDSSLEQEKRSIELLEYNLAEVEPMIVNNEPSDKQQVRASMQGNLESVKLKDAYTRSRDLWECRNVENSNMACSNRSDTQVKDTSHKEQSTDENLKSDVFVAHNQPGTVEAPTRAFEGTIAEKHGKERLAEGKPPTNTHEQVSAGNTPGGYDGAYGNHPQANDHSKADSLNSGLARLASGCGNVGYGGSKSFDTQGKFRGEGLSGQAYACVQNQVSVHMQMSRGSVDTGFLPAATQNGSAWFDPSVAPRGMHGMGATNSVGGGCRMFSHTQGLLRASAQVSFRHPHQMRGRGWQGNGPLLPSPVYRPLHPQQRPPLGLHNPSQFSAPNPSNGWPVPQPRPSLPCYPPYQERPSSQGNVHAPAGGWFEN